jgi:hypothetical protein
LTTEAEGWQLNSNPRREVKHIRKENCISVIVSFCSEELIAEIGDRSGTQRVEYAPWKAGTKHRLVK